MHIRHIVTTLFISMFLTTTAGAALITGFYPGWLKYQKKAAGRNQQVNVPLNSSATPSGNTYTDPLTGMEFVWVPGGCFDMGSPASEIGRYDDEGPVHKVCVDGFYMGKYEVTVQQFRKFIEDSGYRTDAEKEGWSWVYKGKLQKENGVDWHNDYKGDKAANNLPVIHVSWNDAHACIQWLNKKSGKHYRLPTEAEFEYANRAGSTSKYWWGNGSPTRKVANVGGEETNPANGQYWKPKFEGYNDGYWGPAPVGSFAANPFGLYDTTGNVWEWCQDRYASDYYRNSPRHNPPGPSTGSSRVVRGGCCCNFPRNVRSAHRFSNSPGSRYGALGFRPVHLSSGQ